MAWPVETKQISFKRLQELYEEHEATLEHASGPWHWVVCSCGWNSDVTDTMMAYQQYAQHIEDVGIAIAPSGSDATLPAAPATAQALSGPSSEPAGHAAFRLASD